MAAGFESQAPVKPKAARSRLAIIHILLEHRGDANTGAAGVI
jgi:hypothetical protein